MRRKYATPEDAKAAELERKRIWRKKNAIKSSEYLRNLYMNDEQYREKKKKAAIDRYYKIVKPGREAKKEE